MQKPIREIDGSRFGTLEEFFDEVGRQLIPGASWGRNLDAFNDILGGGFGTPDREFILIWHESARSRERLGHAEVVRQLERRLAQCRSSNRDAITEELRTARQGKGPTVFDWLVEIISEHANIDLRLQ